MDAPTEEEEFLEQCLKKLRMGKVEEEVGWRKVEEEVDTFAN